MKTLKKRPVACLIALLIVLASLVFGVNRSLAQQVTAVNDQFHLGVFDEETGQRRTSIHSQLDRRITGTLRILAIGDLNLRYGESFQALHGPATDLREARETLRDLLEAGASPRALFQADQTLTIALDRYYALLHPLVSAETLQTLEEEYEAIVRAAQYITESGYNEAVGAFNRTIWGQFPVSLLRAVIFVQPPEMFA